MPYDVHVNFAWNSRTSRISCEMRVPFIWHKVRGPGNNPGEGGGDPPGVGDDSPRCHTEKRHGQSFV